MEENFINRLRQQIKYLKVKSNTKGITMIALVVTLIVLLIVIGVSIGAVNNSDGLLKKTSATNELYNKEKSRVELETVLQDATRLKFSSTGLTESKLNEMLEKIGTVSGNEVTINGYTYTIDKEKLEIID